LGDGIFEFQEQPGTLIGYTSKTLTFYLV